MIEASEVIKLMNKATQSGQEFLFGIDYEMTSGFFITNPKQSTKLLWRVGEHTNAKEPHLDYRPGSFFRAQPISFLNYQTKFGIIQHHLTHGNSFLANLTVQTPIHTDFSFQEIFYRSNSPYAICIPDQFVCYSPETFVQYADGCISSNPMKGTISGEVPNAKEVILKSYKESAEHFTIVDFVRSELSRVGTHVNVTDLRYIDTLHTSKGDVLQVSSRIEAQVAEHYRQNLGDMIASLLPAASICGAPKKATLMAISQAEEQKRGFYTGVFGYFDGAKLDCAVMIRFLEKINQSIVFKSGGGITINSNCKDEYDEVLAKVYLPFID